MGDYYEILRSNMSAANVRSIASYNGSTAINTDLFTDIIIPAHGLMGISLGGMTAAGKLSLLINGSSIHLNKGLDLTANSHYGWDKYVTSGDTVNYQINVSTGLTLNIYFSTRR